MASFRLQQSYDFFEASQQTHRQGPVRPWSEVLGLLDVRFDAFETNTQVKYFPYHNATNTSSRVLVRNQRGDFAQLSFTQTYKITESLDVDFSTRTEVYGLGAGLNFRYVTLLGSVHYSPVANGIQSWTAETRLHPPGKCWGLQWLFNQLVGDREINTKFNFEFQFGGTES